ncbi:glycosyltransferase family A protein [Rhodococcus kroppenstedtii]|uniref:glycosyltransferase n=1 Tax=Rhodococcoides kroppenstedtii TaxID=293050 RepID=UPI0029538E9E|nr:glycosyltransferase family A protein [Rhodococcus kroppenstedtii]MDV7196126.1 glycosyltransferase family A protein [Rhodococcus kroppenstedtii]
MTRPTLSVVVPTYNESAVIEACLDALLAQSDEIHEIVVVDNNSHDDTVDKIKARAADHADATGRDPVVVLHETRQGLPFARDTGLNAATGDVLARIDADARVEPGWANATREFFARHGETYAAGSGTCTAYDLPFQDRFRAAQDALGRTVAAKLAEGDDVDAPRLFGSNMALTRGAWHRIRPHTSTRTDIFEDVDLTICAIENGIRCAIIPDARALISGRRFKSGPLSYLRYSWCDQRTFAIHGRSAERRRAVATLVTATIPFYLAMWVPFRLWNPESSKFELTRLIRPINE